MPCASARLRLNPLYQAVDDGFAVNWPSRRYEEEYAERATYPGWLPAADDQTVGEEAVRRRVLVDLPERW